jgi:hypothetical protein
MIDYSNAIEKHDNEIEELYDEVKTIPNVPQQ